MSTLEDKLKKRYIMRRPSSQRKPIPNREPSPAEIPGNTVVYDTDYAKEYIEQERQNMRKPVVQTDNFDSVSVITETTVMTSKKSENDAFKDELNLLCRTYNLAYRENRTLGITSMRNEIVSLIETNSVVVIQGPTGCGKTTQVPQFILDNAFKKREQFNIVVTQPRRIAAVSIAKRVCAERDWQLGTLVGYRVGMGNCTSKDTKVTFCTTGVLLRRLIQAKHLLDYTHIILDEVHERDQDMDFLLLVVRKLLWLNSRSVKVILMSATINSAKFADYFSSPVSDTFVSAPIVSIDKRSSYNVNKYFIDEITGYGEIPEINLDDPRISSPLYKFAVKLVVAFDEIDEVEAQSGVSEENKRHVVLVFLPGIWEIEEFNIILQSQQYAPFKWDVVVLHSTITNEEQQRIFEPVEEGYRRIILSTNIAESSITVPNVKYVIDFCLTKVQVFDVVSNLQSLELRWASRASCEQRAGRTGRVMDGRVYRLVTKNIFENHFSEESSPEMLRAPLEKLVLNAKLLDMGEPKAILALSIDPPDLTNLRSTILKLKEAGAMLNSSTFSNPLDGEVTRLGFVMAALPTSIHVAKLIALGHVFGLLRNAIIIGAALSTKSLFSNPFQRKNEAYNAKLKWSSGSWSDPITYLHAYQVWMAEKANRRINNRNAEKNWARRHFIQLNVLYEMQTLVTELMHRLKQEGITLPLRTAGKDLMTDLEKALVLKVIIAGAFYPNYFVSYLAGNQKDERERLKASGGLDPLTTVYLHGWSAKQNGMLYAHRFQDLFKECTYNSTRKIRLHFGSSTMVYVSFPKSNSGVNQGSEERVSSDFNVNGKIPISIYKALRIRKNKADLYIPILKDSEAHNMRELLQLPDNQLLSAQSIIKTQKKVSSMVQPELPKMGTQVIPIKIRYIYDPATFWAVLDDPETQAKWTTVHTCANNLSLSEEIKEQPPLGSLVLARYPLNKMYEYFRCVVDNYYLIRNEKAASVRLLDIGCRVDVMVRTDLRTFRSAETTAHIPALAFPCTLANIKPSVLRNMNGSWSSQATDEFSRLISSDKPFTPGKPIPQGKLYGEIYSVVNNVVALNLYNQRGSSKIHVNEALISSGYASYKPESYLSRQNHDVRKKYNVLTEAQIEYYEANQYEHDHLTDLYPEPPEESQCSSTVKLTGPYSPLEIQLAHLILTSEGKSVAIDSTSVNSILLDPNPEEFQQCLVVAGHVNQNLNGNKLLLRDTTLMPNIRGLTALLAMIFTPRLEMRCNDFGSRYTGALCGLGQHAYTKKPIFPEHDMEISFDVEINNEDLCMINKLRHWMSTTLHPSDLADDDDDERLLQCQATCRSILMDIIEKDRKPQTVEKWFQEGQWGLCDESKLLRPRKNDMIINIYPLHYAVELLDINPYYEEMFHHLEELKEIAAEDPRKYNCNITCQLCQETVFGVYQLRTHISVMQHTRNEKELRNNHLNQIILNQEKIELS